MTQRTSTTTNGSPGSGALSATDRKHQAILDAAQEVFLRSGYPGTNMDELAAFASVSKQTVYKHFQSKEALFIEVVSRMTTGAGDRVLHDDIPTGITADTLTPYLIEYADRQLCVVLTPRLMQLRRLVISEVPRFPELAKVLYDLGPQRAMTAMVRLFTLFHEQGLLKIENINDAASQFNWLVMAEPLNLAMLLGDEAIPDRDTLRSHAEKGVAIFLSAYRAT
ncbi:MAG: TetR/AcrR family transcriptional regulator [Thermomicrobiales bacterium]